MSDDIIDQFVTSTNAYATSNSMRGWVDINSNDLLVFIAAMTYLGVVKLPKRRAAWGQKGLFSQPFLKSLLTAIWSYLPTMPAICHAYLPTTALAEHQYYIRHAQ